MKSFLFIAAFLTLNAANALEKAGQTQADCPFQATFYAPAKDTAHALLEVDSGSGVQKVELYLTESQGCERMLYRSQQVEIPTYSVEMTKLCQGSLPRVTGKMFLSGVALACDMSIH